MTNCLNLPAALKCATWYQNTNMNTFAQNGAPSFLTPFLNPMTCYANFFQWLNPHILVMKSIISDPSKNSFTKEKLSLGHFWFDPFCAISPKEYQCSDGYQCILDPLITKIIHVLAFLRPKVAQLHFWWFFKASLVPPWCTRQTFHRKTGRQISVPVFQIIQKLSLSLKFWQNYLIDWA